MRGSPSDRPNRIGAAMEAHEPAHTPNTMVRWTRLVVAHRRILLISWVVLLLLGGWAASDLGRLLTNRFSVPGSDAEAGLSILRTRFHERGDGQFTLVVRAGGGTADLPASEAAARRAAAQVPGGRAGIARAAT